MNGKQRELFGSVPPEIEDIPASRRTDPDASRRAELLLNASGRRRSTAQRVFDRLREGPARTSELVRISHRFGGRIHELRKLLKPAGWVITCENFPDGENVYKLTSEPRGDRG